MGITPLNSDLNLAVSQYYYLIIQFVTLQDPFALLEHMLLYQEGDLPYDVNSQSSKKWYVSHVEKALGHVLVEVSIHVVFDRLIETRVMDLDFLKMGFGKDLQDTWFVDDYGRCSFQICQQAYFPKYFTLFQNTDIDLICE